MEKRTANQQHRKIDKGGAPQKGTDQQNEQNLDELVEKTRLLKQLKEAGISVGHEEFGAWEQRMHFGCSHGSASCKVCPTTDCP